MIESFKPILGALPHTLVLGSCPSVISLEKAEYYGNKRNAFWPIMNDVFGGNGFKSFDVFFCKLFEFLTNIFTQIFF